MDGSSAALAPEAERGNWLLVVSLMLIYSYAFVDRIVLALLVDPIKRDLHASDFQMSLLLGLAFASFYGLFSIPAGHFADRVNRRRLIAFGSVGWALMTIVCGLASNVTELFLGRAGVGIMEAAIAPAAYSLIRDTVPARSRGLAFSTYALSPIIGSALSLAGGGFLLKLAVAGAFADLPMLGGLAPWRITLVLVGLAGLPLSLFLLTFREPHRDTSVARAGGGMLRGLVQACRYIVTNRGLYGPLLVFAGTGAMMSFSYNTWFPTAIARRFALAPQQVGPVLGAIALLSGAAGLLVGGMVMNRLTRRGGSVLSYAVVAVIGTALGVGGACLSPSLSLTYVLATFGIFFLGISNPAGATKLTQTTPPEMIGRISAVYLLVQTLVGQTLGPLSVALAGERLFSGPSSIAFGLSLVQASCGAVAAGCALFLLRRFRLATASNAS